LAQNGVEIKRYGLSKNNNGYWSNYRSLYANVASRVHEELEHAKHNTKVWGTTRSLVSFKLSHNELSSRKDTMGGGARKGRGGGQRVPWGAQLRLGGGVNQLEE